jgi:DHA3 family macrolide efflux protein-like MFS transporter
VTDVRGRNGWTFLVMWLGQTVSLIGSALTQFGLGVWVFQRTGSVAQYALINLFILLPQIAAMPFAGVIADRYPRRLVMIVANIGGAATGALLALLLATGSLAVWLAYVMTLLFALSSALLFPAYNASVPMLVPERHLSRANGLIQFGQSVARVLTLPLAGVLVVTIGLRGMVIIDLVSFVFAAVTLVPLVIPQPAGGLVKRRRVLREAADGLRYIVPRPSLFNLLLFFAALNLSAGFVGALHTPLVLSFASVQALGLLTGINAVGLVLGSVLMTVWGGPKRRIYGVLIPGFTLGAAIVIMGAHASLVFIAAGGILVQFSAAVANVSSSTLWQTRVPKEMQGRVLGSVRTISFATVPLAIILAGPLADRVLEPLMAPSGALASSVGLVLGVGRGRGIGLLLVLVGLLAIGAATVSALLPALRRLDDEPAPQPAPVPSAV